MNVGSMVKRDREEGRYKRGCDTVGVISLGSVIRLCLKIMFVIACAMAVSIMTDFRAHGQLSAKSADEKQAMVLILVFGRFLYIMIPSTICSLAGIMKQDAVLLSARFCLTAVLASMSGSMIEQSSRSEDASAGHVVIFLTVFAIELSTLAMTLCDVATCTSRTQSG